MTSQGATEEFLELPSINWIFVDWTGFNDLVSLLLPRFLNTEADTSCCVFDLNSPRGSEDARHQRKVQLQSLVGPAQKFPPGILFPQL